MITSYQGAVVIVTGASSGIGAAFASELARAGAKVAVCARRADKLHAFAATLPGETLVVVGDVTLPADRQRLIEAVIARWGRVDVLINNAGKMGAKPFAQLAPAEVEDLLAVNLLAPIHLTHLVLPHFAKQGGGLVINLTSSAGELGIPGVTAYAAAKGGLTSFSQALYRELQAQNIHVLTVKPGYTASEMAYTPEQLAKLKSMTPQTPTHVAHMALRAGLQKAPVVLTDSRINILVWLNQTFPRLMDRLLPKIF